MVQEGSALPPRPLCVDRAPQRAVVQAMVSDVRADSPRVAVIVGPGGIGKSTLLEWLAHDVRTLFEDVLYYEIPRGTPRSLTTADDVAAHLLCQLGMDWHDLPPRDYRVDALRSRIAGRPVLLVLDNLADPAQLWPLLGDLTKAFVIAASPAGAEVWFDPSRCRSVPLRGFADQDGVDLLRSFAGSAVETVDSAVLQRFVSISGGHPELLREVARRLSYRDESAEEYLGLLGGATANELESELAVGDVSIFLKIYESEYRSLTGAEATAYRLLGVLPVSRFDVERAAAAFGRTVRETRRLLRRLADGGLVREHRDGGYSLPDMAREHARAKAAQLEPVERERAARESIGSCVELAVSLAKSASSRPVVATVARDRFAAVEARYHGEGAAARAMADFAFHWPMCAEAALAAARAGLVDDAVVLWLSLWPFGYHTNSTSELIDGYRDLLDMAESGEPRWASIADSATRWQLHRDLGALYERIGEWALAFDHFRHAEDIDYPPGLASVLEWQAIVLAQQERPQDALDKIELAWDAVPLLDDPGQQRRSYTLLRMHKGRFLFALAEYSASESELRSALGDFLDRDNDKHNAARCRVLLGRIALRHRSDPEAQQRLLDALEGLTGYAMCLEAAAVRDLLAEIADRAGNTAEAEEHRRCAAELRFSE